MEEKNVVVGLIAGRHEMPVEQYLFTKIHDRDCLNFPKLEQRVEEFLLRQGLIVRRGHQCRAAGKGTLTVYITGLTSACVAVIKCCSKYRIPLTLMHYNAKGGNYCPQFMCEDMVS